MNNKRTVIVLSIGFIFGVATVGAGALAVKKGMPFLGKVKKKLEQRRIDNIPMAKKELMLFDFERKNEDAKWNFTSTTGDISKEHSSSGKYSMKVTFAPSTGAAAVKLEDYFEKSNRLSNWSRYEILSFDIYNPGKGRERIILQIMDKKGYKIKRDIYLRAGRMNTIEIDIRSLWESVKMDRIKQFNLFLWNNPAEKIFYIDNMKLLPSASMGKKGRGISSEEFLPKENENIYKTGDYFFFDRKKWSKISGDNRGTYIEVPLIVDNPLAVNVNSFHVSGGIPFGRGELKSPDNAAIYDESGKEILSQFKILSKWPDDSVKWLLCRSKADLLANKKTKLYLRYGKDMKRKKAKTSLIVKENRDKIILNTGVLKISLNKKQFYLFDAVWVDKNSDGRYSKNELVMSKSDLVLSRDGREYYSSLDKNYKLTVEENGPAKACVKAEGWFVNKRGKEYCKVITRIYVAEGSSDIRVQHTFIYTGYPENKYHYLYKGKRLPRNETIDSIYITMPIKMRKKKTLAFGADDTVLEMRPSRRTGLYQKSHDSYKAKTDGKLVKDGKKLDGWFDLSSDEWGISLGVKNFWQQYPKAYRFDAGSNVISVDLWPKEAGKLDLKTTAKASGPGAIARGSAFGLAKTHEIFINFHRGDFNSSGRERVIKALSNDILLTASPEWVSDTRALGRIEPAGGKNDRAENFLWNMFDWANRQIDAFNWYGMIDFGDTLSWYRKSGFDKSYGNWGWHPEGRHGWYNCEGFGTHSGVLSQYLRTGIREYFNYGANLTRHIMDIDTCHYNTVKNDKRLRKRIPDDYSRVGSMHRHNGDHWGGRNEEASHTNINGLLLYYYITGDDRARDVLDEVGQFFLDERITYYKHPDIAPQRTLANVLWGVVQLYELTGDEKYRKAADKWAQLFYMGQKGNGAWPETYNPVKKSWEGKPHMMYIESYTLPALIAYHKMTGNKAIAECIVEAADYLMENSKYGAYFDATAYAYWLTGDSKYRDNIKNRLNFNVSRQNKKDDPMWNGMIYQKALYARPSEYLYKMPFAFGPLADRVKPKTKLPN